MKGQSECFLVFTELSDPYEPIWLARQSLTLEQSGGGGSPLHIVEHIFTHENFSAERRGGEEWKQEGNRENEKEMKGNPQSSTHQRCNTLHPQKQFKALAPEVLHLSLTVALHPYHFCATFIFIPRQNKPTLIYFKTESRMSH